MSMQKRGVEPSVLLTAAACSFWIDLEDSFELARCIPCAGAYHVPSVQSYYLCRQERFRMISRGRLS